MSEIGIPNPASPTFRCSHVTAENPILHVAVLHTESGVIFVECCRECISKGVRGIGEDGSILLAS